MLLVILLGFVIQTQTVYVMYGHFDEHIIVNMQGFLQKIPKNAIFCAFSDPGGIKPKKPVYNVYYICIPYQPTGGVGFWTASSGWTEKRL